MNNLKFNKTEALFLIVRIIFFGLAILIFVAYSLEENYFLMLLSLVLAGVIVIPLNIKEKSKQKKFLVIKILSIIFIY